MTAMEKLQKVTNEPDEDVLQICLDTAFSAIMSRRFPYQEWPEQIEKQYEDLQYRCALDLYNKRGAEGELVHTENGTSRSYESSWISEQLLREVVPFVGVLG